MQGTKAMSMCLSVLEDGLTKSRDRLKKKRKRGSVEYIVKVGPPTPRYEPSRFYLRDIGLIFEDDRVEAVRKELGRVERAASSR